MLDAEADAYYFLVTEFDGTGCETLANRRLPLRGFVVINRHGEWSSRYSTQDIEEATTVNSRTGLRVARLGALFYFAWGLFHVGVAHDIYLLRVVQFGITQGRIFQFSAYMLSIAAFAICVAAAGNWRNSRVAVWLNLFVVGWADSVWVNRSCLARIRAPGPQTHSARDSFGDYESHHRGPQVDCH